jgi:hypothetical protein
MVRIQLQNLKPECRCPRVKTGTCDGLFWFRSDRRESYCFGRVALKVPS